MSTRKLVNATDILSPSLLRQLQTKLRGKGTLLYVPALEGWYDPPYHLRMVDDLTERGWSAARIAHKLGITPRQVYRLRQRLREDPACLRARQPVVEPQPQRSTPHRDRAARSMSASHSARETATEPTEVEVITPTFRYAEFENF